MGIPQAKGLEDGYRVGNPNPTRKVDRKLRLWTKPRRRCGRLETVRRLMKVTRGE